MNTDRPAYASADLTTLAVLRAAALLDGANTEFDEGNRRFAGKLARDAGEEIRAVMDEDGLDAEHLPELFEKVYRRAGGESIDERLLGDVGAEETTEKA